MEIYPENLGIKSRQELARIRDHAATLGTAPNAGRGSGRQNRTIWAVFTLACWCAFASILLAGLHLSLIFALLIAVFGALLGHFYIVFGRYLIHGSRPGPDAPLTAQEISRLRKAAPDAARRRYCDLLMTALLTPPFAEERTEQQARQAVQTLGATIDELPDHDPSALHDNSTELIVAAAGLAVDADHETDSVVADSLKRRVESLRRQAETVSWTATAVRRSLAFRSEVAEQIDALRTSLVALSVGGANAGTEMAELAASIQNIASAAQAITEARTEVDQVGLTRDR